MPLAGAEQRLSVDQDWIDGTRSSMVLKTT